MNVGDEIFGNPKINPEAFNQAIRRLAGGVPAVGPDADGDERQIGDADDRQELPGVGHQHHHGEDGKPDLAHTTFHVPEIGRAHV